MEKERDENETTKRFECTCCICQKKRFFETTYPKMKTTKLCVLILQSLKMLHPTNDCFSIKNDIINFINDHWHLLVKLQLFQSSNWKKALLDALNHCPLIECGKDFCHDRGYYRLKETNVCSTFNEEKTVGNPPLKELDGDENKEKVVVSNELYQCYQDLEREINNCIKVMTKILKIYYRNNDDERIHIVNDILFKQQLVSLSLHNHMLSWSTF